MRRYAFGLLLLLVSLGAQAVGYLPQGCFTDSYTACAASGGGCSISTVSACASYCGKAPPVEGRLGTMIGADYKVYCQVSTPSACSNGTYSAATGRCACNAGYQNSGYNCVPIPVTCNLGEFRSGGAATGLLTVWATEPLPEVCSGGCKVKVSASYAGGGWSGNKSGTTCTGGDDFAPLKLTYQNAAASQASGAQGSATAADVSADEAEAQAAAAAAYSTAAEASKQAAAAAAAAKAAAPGASEIGGEAWWAAQNSAVQAAKAAAAAAAAADAFAAATVAAQQARVNAEAASGYGGNAGAAAAAAAAAATLAAAATEHATAAGAAEAAAGAAAAAADSNLSAGYWAGQGAGKAGEAAQAKTGAEQGAPEEGCQPGAAGCPTKIDEAGTPTQSPINPDTLVQGTGADQLTEWGFTKPLVAWAPALPQASESCMQITSSWRSYTVSFPNPGQCEKLHRMRDFLGYLLYLLTGYAIIAAFLQRPAG